MSEYQENIDYLKQEGLFYEHQYLAGYTEKVEELLQADNFRGAEDFTYDFFYRKGWFSEQAMPYIPAVVSRMAYIVPDILSQLDVALDPNSNPIE